MALGVTSEKRARSKEERIPLPYWREPRRAAAEPVIESSALLRAAAFEHAATIPLVLKMRSIGKTTAQRLRKFPILNSSKRAKARVQLVAVRKRFRREKRSTNRRLSILMIETPIILIPKKNP